MHEAFFANRQKGVALSLLCMRVKGNDVHYAYSIGTFLYPIQVEAVSL